MKDELAIIKQALLSGRFTYTSQHSIRIYTLRGVLTVRWESSDE